MPFVFITALHCLLYSLLIVPITDVDLLIEENHRKHHTDKFKLTRNSGSLILRRGQTFKLILQFEKEVDIDDQEIFFNLKLGKNPQVHNKSNITVKKVQRFDIKQTPHEWMFRLLNTFNAEDDIVEVEIYIPPKAIPGKYKMDVINDEDVFGESPNIFILFNPWSRGIRLQPIIRGGSRAAGTFKMERFVIIVNCWKLLTIITKHSILDVAAALDPPLIMIQTTFETMHKN